MANKRTLLTIFLLAFLSATSVSAQNNRSAVSINGSDLATCTVLDPCRSFAVAMSRTNNRGEVIALDSGGYGPFSITRSVTILAPAGVHAALTTTAGTGVYINALNTDKVVLRNLYIGGMGGAVGIHFDNGAALALESVTVDNFSGIGIHVQTGPSYVSIEDVVVRHTGNTCIYLAGSEGAIRAVINRTRTEDSSNGGIHAVDDAKATIKDSIMARLNWGILVNFGASAAIENSVSTFNGTGLIVSSAGSASISNSTFSFNTLGLEQSGGTLFTRGNNHVAGNTTASSGAMTPLGGI